MRKTNFENRVYVEKPLGRVVSAVVVVCPLLLFLPCMVVEGAEIPADAYRIVYMKNGRL